MSKKPVVPKEEIIDIEFKLKPKESAVQVSSLFGDQDTSRFEAPEQSWEELTAIYEEAARGIVDTGNNINNALSVPGVKENVPDLVDLNVAVNGLSNDLKLFSSELVRIKDRHKNKSGPITTPQDLALSLTIFDDYVNFVTQYKAVTLPTVLTIMDQVGAACSKLYAQIEKEEATEAAETTIPVVVNNKIH